MSRSSARYNDHLMDITNAVQARRLIIKCNALARSTVPNIAYNVSLLNKKQTQENQKKRKKKKPECYGLPFARVFRPMVFTCWDVAEIPQEELRYFFFFFPSSFSFFI